MIILICCWCLFAKILLRIWVLADGGFVKWFWKFSFLCNFLEEFEQDRWVWKSLSGIGRVWVGQLVSKLLVEFACEAIWLDFCLLEGFWLQFLFRCLWLVCSYFMFLPGSVLEGYTFLRTCPFLAGCSVYWRVVPCSSLLRSFIFCGVCSNFFFTSNCIDFSPLPFFLMSLAKGLSLSFIFSKNQLLVLLIFAIVSITFVNLFLLWSLWFLSIH